ncbi:MAG: twin-arginine translocase subunit TatC [Eubacteriales bacterium]|nr:twin-arginine translocase subunit TatC [Eubacteriales bacterium]
MKRRKSSEKNMTLSGHLRELRKRVIICVICLVVSFFIGLNFAPELVSILTGIGEQYGYTYIFIAPQELLMQYFSVAMLASVCITLPILVYHIWAFVRPGLRRNENILFVAALIFGLICFVLGVLFAYKVMMPFMLYFLMDLSAGSEIAASISVQSYMSFVLSTFTIFGIIFELPVMSVLLTQLGFLKVKWMKKGRKFVIIAIFFIAAVITPPDVVSQIMVAIPVLGLYELSIVICTLLMKLRERRHREKEEE